MYNGKVARCQTVAAEIDERGGNDREIRNSNCNQQHQNDVCPRTDGGSFAHGLLYAAGTLAADQIIASARCNVILQHPHTQTDAHQHGRERGRTAKVDGCYGGVAVDLGGKHLKPDALAQRRGSAVFRQRFHKHQQRTDGVIAGKQR